MTFFYFTYLCFLTFFPSFRLVTMAMTNTFSCHTICQKSPTVLGFGPVIIMFRHFILIHIHFFFTFNISDLTHILVSTDLEMQCKLHRRQYSETIVFFFNVQIVILLKTITMTNHSNRVSLKPLCNWR